MLTMQLEKTALWTSINHQSQELKKWKWMLNQFSSILIEIMYKHVLALYYKYKHIKPENQEIFSKIFTKCLLTSMNDKLYSFRVSNLKSILTKLYKFYKFNIKFIHDL